MAHSAEVNARRAIANNSKKRRKAGSADTDNAVNAILAGARAGKALAPVSGEEGSGEKDGLAGFLDKPVIKHAIDALSVGTYASANTVNEIVNGAKDIAAGDTLKGIGGIAWSPVEGIAKGLSGAVGNEENDITFSKVIENVDGELPEDASKLEKGVRGGVGFALDVALDPLTYATLGGAVAVKGGVRAAQAATAAKKANEVASSGAASATPFVAKGRVQAFKEGYKTSKADHKLSVKEDKEFRKVKRSLKGKSNDEAAQWLEDNVEGLLPAVASRAVAETERAIDAQRTVARRSETTSDKGDLGAALDAPTIVDNVLGQLPKFEPGPSSKIPTGVKEARLGNVKPPTIEAQVLDRIADIRATPTPKKDAPVDATAKVSSEATPDQIDFAAFERFIRNAGKSNVGLETSKGTVTNAKKMALAFIGARNNPQAQANIVNSLAPMHKESFIKAVSPVEEVADGAVDTTGNIRNIAKDIRTGKIDAKQFEDLAGTADPKGVAKFLDQIAKTPEFRQTDKSMRAYNTGSRLGISRPESGISGHSLLAMPSERYSAKDILASKTPASEAEATAFLEAKYTEAATQLSQHKLGAELRTIADDVFYSAVGVQKLVGGTKTTRRGATTNGVGEGAKFEKVWNTHASIYPIQHVVNEARRLAPKNPSLKDDIVMTVMRDVDNRLRLAGVDPHLSNMRVTGDKTIIRLAPSDVFDAMPKAIRMKHLWGTGKAGAINEVLPTTVLDVAEILVRSVTKLNPDGTIDYAAAMSKAVDALNGTTGTKYGSRTINSNLDKKTEMKNWEQVILHVAGGKSNTYKRFLGAKTYEEKLDIAIALKAAKPEAVMEANMLRLDANINSLLQSFVKGFREGEPSVLSDLIATNMRNASINAGNVSRRITQISAEHSARILETFNNGTPTQFLNELVVKPPYPHNGPLDPAVARIRDDLKLLAQSSVINGHEAAHFNAIGDVGNIATKPHVANEAASRNARSFQELPETVEMGRINPKDLTPENMDEAFDIAVREANIDVIYRAFGPSRHFNKRAGLGRSFESIAGSTHAATHLMTGFHNILRSWAARGVTKEQARVAFKEVQNKTDDIPLSDFAREMEDTVKFMFSTDPKVNNFLTRNTVGPDHFNKVLNSLMDDDAIQVPVGATPDEMAMAWKNWNIENPIDFFSKMMRAMVKTAEDVSMGASFTKKFGSATPKPGYVRPYDSSNSSEFLPLIDTSLYYPREVVDEIPMIGRLMVESRTFKPGTGLHTFVTRVFDPVISNIKMTQTTLKPGHHVMSVAGDGLRNSLAGMGGSTKEYGSMWRVLHSRFGAMKGQEAMDKWADVKNVVHSVDVGKNTNQRYETMVIGGKKVRVGHNDLYGIMEQKGVVLPPHIGGTDIDELADFDQFGQAANGVIRGIDKVTSGVNRLANPNHGVYSLNNFTAHRDSLMRGALFMHFAQSKNFKSLDEAAEYAAQEVRRWAPTSADLGGMEAKYARRMFFYYTWLRGTLPRIIEGALTRPGVALVPSKAMYNLAAANGLDPSSIGDPFPEGSLFPSWYSEKVIGPQWESKEGDLWGFNPTSPVLDVMNSLGSGVTPKDLMTGAAIPKVSGTLMNMSTPWFKTPAELITGKTLDGGRPIEDNSQYLTDMIGPARVASKITGKDLIPSMSPDGEFGFANRTGAKFEDGLGSDMGPNAAHELLNWALGMGATNYTSDSSVNSALYEENDKLKQEKEQALRYGG